MYFGDSKWHTVGTEIKIFVSKLCLEPRGVKQESKFLDESLYNEDSMDQNHVEADPVLAFEEPVADVEERQIALMEKMVCLPFLNTVLDMQVGKFCAAQEPTSLRA